MKNFTSRKSIKLSAKFLLVFTLLSATMQAQVVRNYGLVYSNSLRGGHTVFGNTMMNIVTTSRRGGTTVQTAEMNDFGNYSNGTTSQYGNDNSDMEFVDVDTNTTTHNSSAAALVLPSGTNTIKFARLYWGGRITSGMGANNNLALRTIKIRKDTVGNYDTAVAPVTQIDKANVSGTDSVYQSYVDVTTYIQNNGAGYYTIADLAAATGSVGSGGNYSGWCIVVVYENPASSFSNVRVYDGFIQVFDGGSTTSQSIVLNGFNAPSTPLDSSDAYMTTVAWEGDANLAASTSNPLGDYIRINDTTVSNAQNPAVNFWNGTISNNGVAVTTKKPNYVNQMGIDIDEANVGVGYGILPNATTVTAEFGTEADQYFPSLFAFTMKTKDPSISLAKSVADATPPYHVLQPSEVLTYTLTGSNVGVGAAYNCVIVDSIPNNVTYIPNTLKVTAASDVSSVGGKTDAYGDDAAFIGTNGATTYAKFFVGTGATDSTGGVLQQGENYTATFQVLTPSNANNISTVVNTARFTANSISGDPFVTDATAIIGPAGSPLAVKMTDFSVAKQSDNAALIRWTTASEKSNDYYIIESSTDGINYQQLGTVKGAGTTNNTTNYQFTAALPVVQSSVIYYRLLVVDIDGNIESSPVNTLHLDNLAVIEGVKVGPNPFVNSLQVIINDDKTENSTIRIVSLLGQELVRRSVTLQPGTNLVELRNLDVLNSGIHSIEIITDKGVVSQKIMKK